MELILDTDFVIAAEREGKRRTDGPVRHFLNSHLSDHFLITFTVAGELACGRSASPRAQWESLCRPFGILPWSLEISWRYGGLYQALRAAGNLIGTNDLWIASTALVHGYPLVTNNHADFGRVPGLDLVAF